MGKVFIILLLLLSIISIYAFSNEYKSTYISILCLLILPPVLLYSEKHPGFALIIAFMLNYINYAKGVPLGIWFLIIFSIVLMISKIVQRKRYFKLDIISLAWLLVAVCLILTIFNWHNYIEATRGTLELLIIPILLYQTINYFIDDEDRVLLLKAQPFLLAYILLQIIVVFVINLWHLISSDVLLSSHFSTFHRLSIGWSWSNYLAAILVFYVLFITSLTQYIFNKKYSIWANSVSVISVIFIVIIMSRGAFASLILGLLIYYVLYEKKSTTGLILLLLSSVGFLVILSNFISKTIERFMILKSDPSSLSRVYMLLNVIKQIKMKPFLGVGPRQYLFNDFYQFHYDPHNYILRYAVDIGIPAALLLVFILIYPLTLIWNRQGNKKVVLTFLPVYIASLLNGLYEITITSWWYGMHFWILYALFVYYMKNPQTFNRIVVNA